MKFLLVMVVKMKAETKTNIKVSSALVALFVIKVIAICLVIEVVK